MHVRLITLRWESVKLFEELHPHDVARYEGCLIAFLTELVPIDAREPAMLLDLSDRLGALGGVLGE